MAHQHKTICDGPGCGKDITQGEGVRWRLIAQGEMIPMRPDTEARFNISASPQQHHFCTYGCLSLWAAMELEAEVAGQKRHEARIAAASAQADRV